MKARFCFLLSAALLASSSAAAAEKTPNDVYQALGGLEGAIRAMLDADFVDLPSIEPPETSKKRPRHAYAKILELSEKIAITRRVYGLSGDQLLQPLATIISPDDVFAGVQLLDAATSELFAAYELPSTSLRREPMATGKTPGDVYARASEIVALINHGYLPPTTPNDVYRIAAMIKQTTDALASQLNVTPEPHPAPSVSGKSPSDVMGIVIELSEEISALGAARPNIAPDDGVTRPQAPTAGRVTPAHVREAVGLVLADLMEIYVRAGLETPLDPIATPVGKTPSDVYAAIDGARWVLFAINDA